MTAPPRKRLTIVNEFDKIRSDYDMSRENRFIRRRTGLAPQGGSADYHYRNEADYYRDIEKARDMDRNDCIVGQTVDRSVDNIVQDGFTLDPQTGDSVLDNELYARWTEWASDPELCDIAGEYTWHDYERHACRSMQLDGDCVILGLDTGHLQFIEAHSVQTSTKQADTFLGVTRDEYGKRTKYWIMRDPLEPMSQKETALPVDVRNMDGQRVLMHVYSPKRMSQTRGVTAFAPIFSLAGMFEDIQFAKLVQQQVVSCFAVFREQAAFSSAAGQLPSTAPGYGSPQTEVSPAGTRYIENIAPGMEIVGAPGEKLQGFSPNVPNAEFFTHVKLMLQLIGVNLGLPLCLVLMDGSETNFSGWRGAVDEARKGFRAAQRNLLTRLHTPVYRLKVSQWIAEDAALREASAQRDLYRHKWNCPRWAYIDPVGDAQGDQLRLQNNLTSPRRLHAERGAEWQEIADETIEDYGYAIQRAMAVANRINTSNPGQTPIQWRELISLPMATGTQLNLQDPQMIEATKEAAVDGDE
jgi:lambda family phage portal protein